MENINVEFYEFKFTDEEWKIMEDAIKEIAAHPASIHLNIEDE